MYMIAHHAHVAIIRIYLGLCAKNNTQSRRQFYRTKYKQCACASTLHVHVRCPCIYNVLAGIDNHLENESLIVWFRVSAFPWFRKLYAHPQKEQDLLPGNYSMLIVYSIRLPLVDVYYMYMCIIIHVLYLYIVYVHVTFRMYKHVHVHVPCVQKNKWSCCDTQFFLDYSNFESTNQIAQSVESKSRISTFSGKYGHPGNAHISFELPACDMQLLHTCICMYQH